MVGCDCQESEIHVIHQIKQIKFTREVSVQCGSEHTKIIGKVEKGFGDVWTFNKADKLPFPLPPAHNAQVLCFPLSEEDWWRGGHCFSNGQRKVDSPCYFLVLVCCYFIYAAKKIASKAYALEGIEVIKPLWRIVIFCSK